MCIVTDDNWKIIWPLQQQLLLNHNHLIIIIIYIIYIIYVIYIIYIIYVIYIIIIIIIFIIIIIILIIIIIIILIIILQQSYYHHHHSSSWSLSLYHHIVIVIIIASSSTESCHNSSVNFSCHMYSFYILYSNHMYVLVLRVLVFWKIIKKKEGVIYFGTYLNLTYFWSTSYLFPCIPIFPHPVCYCSV